METVRTFVNNNSSSNRLGPFGAILLLIGPFLGSAGCVSVPGEAAGASRAKVSVPQSASGRSIGQDASAFLGFPVAKLEAALGAPALVRLEGRTEFRRYDLGSCRAYAMVVPAGGVVTSLTTGPARVGASAEPLSRCTGR